LEDSQVDSNEGFHLYLHPRYMQQDLEVAAASAAALVDKTVAVAAAAADVIEVELSGAVVESVDAGADVGLPENPSDWRYLVLLWGQR